MRPYTPPLHEGLDILHKDDDFLVLNKPSGLLSVPGRLPENKDSLSSRVQLEYPEATIVHRLDMDTSGIMAMALNKEAHRAISKQFEFKQTRKTYVAVLGGTVLGDEGEVNLPMRCDWPNRPLQVIDFVFGKKSLTKWSVLSRENDKTRVALTPITGRSHQLRVHMLSMGHPILGDPFYAWGTWLEDFDRLQLHAAELSFTHHLTGDTVDISSPIPF